MHLPPHAIHEFRAIWRDEYGEDLPFDEARLVAERFLAGVHQMLLIREPPNSRSSTESTLTTR
jgi:hypothetical protein